MTVPPRIPTEALLAEAGAVKRLAQVLVRRADLAHDIAQDVMVAALRQPSPPANLRSWLAAVTRRLAGKAARSRRLRASAEGIVAPPASGDGEARTDERLRLHQRLTEAVLALPEPYRTTVMLRFFDELPPRVIAQRLAVSSEVVRKRLSRGIDTLRERLDADFGDRGRWAHAFAASGLLVPGSPWLLVSVLAMNKLALAGAATLVAAALWMLVPHDDVSMRAPTVTTDATKPRVGAAMSVGVAGAAAAERTEAMPAPVTTVAPECVVVVVDARARPVADATVHCWADGGADAAMRSTDAEGRCSFGRVGGAGGLLVDADGHALRHVPLTSRAAEHRITLEDGASIEGVLLVDGQPGVGQVMRFRDLDVGDAVPPLLRDRYRWRGARATCGRNGEFRFAGLAPGAAASLDLPQSLWLLRGDAGRMVAPRHQLELHATQLPTVRGRLLWSDTNEPVAWAQVMAYAEFVDGQTSPSVGCEAARDGTFAVGLYGGGSDRRDTWRDPTQRPAFRTVRLSFEAAGAASTTKLELAGEALAMRENLVVRMDRARITHFRCVDAAGQPIAGARLKARTVSEATDAEGRGTFAGVASDITLVGSPRHRVGPTTPRAPAAGTADDPLVFELQPTNVVRVQVVGDAAPDARYELRSGEGMFAGGRMRGSLDEALFAIDAQGGASGRTQPDGSNKWYSVREEITIGADGGAVVHSLEPGVACHFAALDDLGRESARCDFTAPPWGESLALELRLPPIGEPFRSRVVDADGKPLEKVEVAFRVEESDDTFFLNRRTDTEGKFEVLHPGDLSRARVTLSCAGYVELRHESVAAGPPPTTFVMVRGREVTVHVVDEQQRPLAVTPVWRDERDTPREWLQEGVWRFRDLPPGSVRFVCRIGDDEFALSHDTASPEATLRVPRPATLRLAAANGWPTKSDARTSLVAVATCLEGDHRTTRISRPQRGDPEQLLPGRWRLDLVEATYSSGASSERSLGMSAEVTLRAGEEATAVLR